MSSACSTTSVYTARPKSKSSRVLNKLYGEKTMHVKAYEFNFKPKQQEYAVSSIGVIDGGFATLHVRHKRFRPFD